MPPPIKKLADKFLNDPKQIAVARPASANLNIDQRLVIVPGPKKRDALRDILREDGFKNAIVFSNRKVTVRELYTSLKRSGFSVGQIHGDMDQSSRIAEFDRFKNDEINVLVASDVAARGLDVKGVSHVVNFDVPWQPDDYIHRIGRTGRAGMTGIAYTLATPADADAISAIEKLTGLKITRSGAAKAEPAEALAEAAEAAASEKPARGRGRARPKVERAQREERAPREERETREERAPREERGPREERATREERAPRDERPEPAPRPAREEQPRAAKPPKPEPRPKTAKDEDSDDWNGPVPSFLNFSAL